jgi:hypothetical protein
MAILEERTALEPLVLQTVEYVEQCAKLCSIATEVGEMSDKGVWCSKYLIEYII